jgi:hypothetical protein
VVQFQIFTVFAAGITEDVGLFRLVSAALAAFMAFFVGRNVRRLTVLPADTATKGQLAGLVCALVLLCFYIVGPVSEGVLRWTEATAVTLAAFLLFLVVREARRLAAHGRTPDDRPGAREDVEPSAT